MIPRIAKTGFSFKGAGEYYLHDKKAQTSERVGWTLTHNVPTKDPHKALKWMAWTSMNQEKLKAEYGGSRAGRKSEGKDVYAYSLAWHKDDNPSREEMEKAAFSSLECLGLKEHEAVIIRHTDREETNPHIHVIANLVHPVTGRKAERKMDYNRLSVWAQEHDRAHGRDHCPERIKNNLERYQDAAKTQFVKHQGEKEHRAYLIQQLLERSDSGKAFRAALQDHGYTLAMGNRNRITIVNEQGNIYGLSRQLTKEDGKTFRAKDVRAALSDVDLKTLPDAKVLGEEREYQNNYFDRDAYAREQEEKLIEAAIEADKAKLIAEKEEKQREEEREKAEIRRKLDVKRQEERHEDMKETRIPYSVSKKHSWVAHEFNSEVEDKGKKEDEKLINHILRQQEAPKQKVKTEEELRQAALKKRDNDPERKKIRQTLDEKRQEKRHKRVGETREAKTANDVFNAEVKDKGSREDEKLINHILRKQKEREAAQMPQEEKDRLWREELKSRDTDTERKEVRQALDQERQKERHDEIGGTREPYSVHNLESNMNAEFNAEVTDEGVKEDEKLIDYILDHKKEQSGLEEKEQEASKKKENEGEVQQHFRERVRERGRFFDDGMNDDMDYSDNDSF